MSGQPQTRQRKGYGGLSGDSDNGESVHEIVPVRSASGSDSRSAVSEPRGYGSGRPVPQRFSRSRYTESTRFALIVASILFILALAFRFYKINHPDQVVFDEVHFGKFAAYYIKREYYFDVHPPLAKMLLGAAGWFVGFDGDFEFATIGDSYSVHHVPYIGIRSLGAFLGSLTVPIVFAIMKESGYPTAIAAFSSLLVLLDNAHVAQTRLILLDAALVFFMALSLLAYIKFRKLRYREYTPRWWAWMFATGTFLACTLGCKMVGLFTFLTIGTAVIVDLWQLLDIKKGLSMDQFWRHFAARALGLILWPAIIYLSFFWIHFKVLKYSGTGDSFMSPQFQETLAGNELLLNSQEIRYYDTVTIKHKDTKVFLHSHIDKYPLRYDDGRISSQGQQVTGYPHNDTNNHWQIIPTKALPATGRGRLVRHGDQVQLLHVKTQTFLLTHDVASPLMPTNQEFTTYEPDETNSRYAETLFTIDVLEALDGEPWKSKSGHFRLTHVQTKVHLWTHAKPLPDWAYKQQEINGNKAVQDRSTTWFVENIITDEPDDESKNQTVVVEQKPVKHRNFFKKFFELQMLMLSHNAGLTASHPYASNPINWPFLMHGISFWTENDKKEQIYLIGNVASWWLCTLAISVLIGIFAADALARRRAVDPIPDDIRHRLINNAGFFVTAWAFHYFPFYLMNRQLFLHHYLPAHLASALVAGAVLNFIVTESIEFPISYATASAPTTRHPRTHTDIGSKAWTFVLSYALLLLGVYLYIAPLTYGAPSLDGDQVNRRRLLSSWTLHFQAKDHETNIPGAERTRLQKQLAQPNKDPAEPREGPRLWTDTADNRAWDAYHAKNARQKEISELPVKQEAELAKLRVETGKAGKKTLNAAEKFRKA
ncbi:hypothetical protein FRB98_003640 [Tulasnella sp. 332]|nr:hypothetical protein FRB98_003640 [Tulasnella sp. 332]